MLTDRDAGALPPFWKAFLKQSPHRCREPLRCQGGGPGGATEQPPASVYLRALLLTGARRDEMAAIKWVDVDFQWRKLTMADKVEVTRTIPLSPYLAQLLVTLPRINEFVFASTGKAGRIADTRASHAKALQSASIEALTIHGLRRSFSLLGEAAGAPAGAIAQVMGHKPSTTAESYRPRSVDALRPFVEQIEAHILALAGVKFDPKAEPAKLRAVK
jgi:integrase